jgi:hypothetical protein
MPAVRIATSTQGLILGVADAMVMHAAGARKAIDWHTFRTWPNSPKMKPSKRLQKKGPAHQHRFIYTKVQKTCGLEV